MPGSRGLDGRVSRVAAAAGQLDQARDTRRAELLLHAGNAQFIREWAAPEDAGPALARALQLGEAAIAELGEAPAPRDITAADLAGLPQHPPAGFLETWRRLGRLWQLSEPGRPPRSVAEVLARCIARANGGQFPFYPEEE